MHGLRYFRKLVVLHARAFYVKYRDCRIPFDTCSASRRTTLDAPGPRYSPPQCPILPNLVLILGDPYTGWFFAWKQGMEKNMEPIVLWGLVSSP